VGEGEAETCVGGMSLCGEYKDLQACNEVLFGWSISKRRNIDSGIMYLGKMTVS
jgi:hypothetical protein